MSLKKSIERFSNELDEVFSENKFVVFLCGPTLLNSTTDDGSALRLRLKELFEENNFEVVLGEDDGLERLRSQYGGMAHDNELSFIKSQCNAIVLIASSVGSFCELGLFSHYHANNEIRKTDFVLILDERYQADVSYINEGPAKAIENFGKLIHGNFKELDLQPIIERLRNWRHVWLTRKQGRPTS